MFTVIKEVCKIEIRWPVAAVLIGLSALTGYMAANTGMVL